jgi:hypothetical protein
MMPLSRLLLRLGNTLVRLFGRRVMSRGRDGCLYFIGSRVIIIVRVLVFYFFVHCNCRIFYTFI